MNIEKVNRVKREIHDRPEWFAPDSPALDVAADRLIDSLERAALTPTNSEGAGQ